MLPTGSTRGAVRSAGRADRSRLPQRLGWAAAARPRSCPAPSRRCLRSGEDRDRSGELRPRSVALADGARAFRVPDAMSTLGAAADGTFVGRRTATTAPSSGRPEPAPDAGPNRVPDLFRTPDRAGAEDPAERAEPAQHAARVRLVDGAAPAMAHVAARPGQGARTVSCQVIRQRTATCWTRDQRVSAHPRAFPGRAGRVSRTTSPDGRGGSGRSTVTGVVPQLLAERRNDGATGFTAGGGPGLYRGPHRPSCRRHATGREHRRPRVRYRRPSPRPAAHTGPGRGGRPACAGCG